MSWELTSPNTGASVSAQATDSVRKLWQKGIDIFEQNTDFWMDFEGPTSRSVIKRKKDTAAGKGQTITFTNMAGFYQEPHHGDELFESSDDFEKIRVNDYQMVVDWMRNAIRYNQRMEEYMGMRGELKSGFNTEMGKWMGRTKSERMFMLFREKLADSSKQVINGKTVDTLVSEDTLDWDSIITMKTTMKRLGGMPAIGGYRKDGKAEFRNFVVAVTDTLDSLEKDTTYKGYLRDGDTRGGVNYLFNTGFRDVRGQIIREYNPIDHDGFGAIGSPLNPKAELGNAITAGTAAFDIEGGGSTAAADETKIKYFKYFPNYGFKFCEGDALAASSDPFYVLIVNPDDGSANARKIGFYKCVANDGHKITVTERLGSGTGGIESTTVGDVTWNTGVWSGKHTETHPVGATIYLANSKGQPYGYTLYLGACAAYRGYGMHQNHRSQQTHEGGFVTDVFVTTVFGQEPRKDVKLRTPGALRLCHAINYAGSPIPPIT